MSLPPPNSNYDITEHIKLWGEPLQTDIATWLNSFGRPLDTIDHWKMVGTCAYKPQLHVTLHFDDGTDCSKKFPLYGEEITNGKHAN